jgi:hypothetical protein
MSEIKVNKISPKQTCTQLTLGDSGDTIIIPAGVNLNTDAIKNLNTSSIITQTNATTITLGYSGSTIAIASGASQTGFGRTGAVNWDTTKKTSGFTAVNGVGYFVDTTLGAITVILPATPSAGDIVAIKDYANTADTNIITINRNGSNVEGVADNPVITNQGGSVTLIYVDATQGWTIVDSAQKSDLTPPTYIVATGGTILTCGDFKTHIFTGPGTFTVCSVGNPVGSNSVEYLVVAGGGGGGYGRGGGGGAGGFRQNYPSPGTGGLPVTAQAYPITVGAGGPASPIGVSGNNSVFSTITSTGGGNGGGEAAYQPSTSGGSGGSGGGAASPGTSGTGNTPPTSPPQGNSGGSVDNGNNLGKGGGGASTVGGSPTIPAPAQLLPGYGGVGNYLPNGIFGPTAPSYGTAGPVPSTRYFAGGGGGSGNCGEFGNGGSGGGGPGGTGDPTPSGTTNTGGGGGGGRGTGSRGRGGSGGSGIVVIRYKFQ